MSSVMNKVIKLAIGEYQRLSNVDTTNFWSKDDTRISGWKLDGGRETSNVGRQCGDDNQSTRRMGITAKGTIPSIAREGGFAIVDGRRTLVEISQNVTNPFTTTCNL